jgi:hypothetical protein
MVPLFGGIWGSSPTDVYAVGEYGTILHYDGNSWSDMTSGSTASLLDVWGSSPSDVYAVAYGGTILHYDGTIWNSTNFSNITAFWGVWGSSSSDVYAVGEYAEDGRIFHYDGNTWSLISHPPANRFQSIWGSSSSDVFVGGDRAILHYDGNSWSTMSSGTTNWLRGIWGSSSTDVYAVGDNGTIVHYDGNSWNPMNGGTTFSLNGGVWGSSSSEVYAAGDNGLIIRYNGSSWNEVVSDAVPRRQIPEYGTWPFLHSSSMFASKADGTPQYEYLEGDMLSSPSDYEVQFGYTDYQLLSGTNIGMPYALGNSWSCNVERYSYLSGISWEDTVNWIQTFTVTAENQTVTVPAGTFTDCFVIEVTGNHPQSWAHTDYWSPTAMGLVNRIATYYVGVETWELKSFA